MPNHPHFDKKTFLTQGAIFRKGEQVWLFSGPPEIRTERPISPALSTRHFFENGPLKWRVYPQHYQYDRTTALGLFSNRSPQISWCDPDFGEFEFQFDRIKKGFDRGEVEKVVPYVFEEAKHKVVTEDIEGFLASSLAHASGFLYGCWDASGGIVGLTPETLVVQRSKHSFDTMAIAGTTSVDLWRQNPESFLKNSKERQEHLRVVEDIQAQLSPLGELSTEETTVISTPHLAHLFTPMRLQSSSPLDFSDLVLRLHPTPALGCTPRSQIDTFLGEFNNRLERGSFGAPFVFSENEFQAEAVVAIRNLIWDRDVLKLGAGCGVVPASDKMKEWQELKQKRMSVKQIFGVS